MVVSACGTSIDLSLVDSAAPAESGSDPGLPDGSATPSATETNEPEGPDPSPPPSSPPVSTPGPVEELPYGEAIDVYFADIENFWATSMPAVFGREFEPVNARVPYEPRVEATIPECDGETGPRDLYEGNAFYCDPDDYIAWDDVGLFPDLYTTYGDFTLGLVIAHEYGHAVQTQVGLDGPTIVIELQADCLAGAWAAAVAAQQTTGVPFERADLDNAIGGFLTFADPLGTPAGDPTAHGTAFDRLNSFAEGFEAGAEICVGYLEDPPQTATILVDRFDATGGNLPLESLLPLLSEDLTIYLDALGGIEVGPGFGAPLDPVEFGRGIGDPAACDGEAVVADEVLGSAYYCGSDGQVYLDRAELEDLWSEVGDFAPGYAVAHSYVMSVVVEFVEDDPAAAVLAADCLVGVWARDVFDEAGLAPSERTHVLQLSAGDLDEGIVGLLLVPPLGPSLSTPEELVTFDRVAEFGRGFFQGFDQCRLVTAG